MSEFLFLAVAPGVRKIAHGGLGTRLFKFTNRDGNYYWLLE
jgi:hypothetical protein